MAEKQRSAIVRHLTAPAQFPDGRANRFRPTNTLFVRIADVHPGAGDARSVNKAFCGKLMPKEFHLGLLSSSTQLGDPNYG